MAIVDGGWSSGTYAQAAWGCSVYYPLISNGGWGNGAWGDNVWGLGNGGLITTSDTVSPNGTFIATISEVANTSSDFSGAVYLQSAVSELVVASETESSQVVLGTSVSESAVVSEEVSRYVQINRSLTEAANAYVDSVASTPYYNVNVKETANTSDTYAGVIAIQAAVVETITANAAPVGIRYRYIGVEENAAVSETMATSATFAVRVIEASNATETVTTGAIFKVALTESVVASEVDSRRLLWEPIDTGNTTSWTLINTNS